MKKIITLILTAVVFVLAASKPADNKQFKEGEWWYCSTYETDELGTVKNYITAEGEKHVTSRDYQDGILIRLVDYGGVEGYYLKNTKEQYFNSCKNIVEENFDVSKGYTVHRTITYKYGKNCQILEKRLQQVYTDSSGKHNTTIENTKYTYKNNKIIEKRCYDYGRDNKGQCLTYTTITNGNKSTTYLDNKSVFKIETIIDKNTKLVKYGLYDTPSIIKTFKESDTKYHECNRSYLD